MGTVARFNLFIPIVIRDKRIAIRTSATGGTEGKP